MTDERSKERTETANNNDIQQVIKLKMYKLVKLASTKEGLENMGKEKNNHSMFATFVNYCLIHLTTSVQWRYHACNTYISDMFTVSDKALCVLIIENNSEDFIHVYNRGVKPNRKDSKPRHTKVDGQNTKKVKGWNAKGIKRFNKQCGIIQTFRGQLLVWN